MDFIHASVGAVKEELLSTLEPAVHPSTTLYLQKSNIINGVDMFETAHFAFVQAERHVNSEASSYNKSFGHMQAKGTHPVSKVPCSLPTMNRLQFQMQQDTPGHMHHRCMVVSWFICEIGIIVDNCIPPLRMQLKVC